jgi:hypothetical protein
VKHFPEAPSSVFFRKARQLILNKGIVRIRFSPVIVNRGTKFDEHTRLSKTYLALFQVSYSLSFVVRR